MNEQIIKRAKVNGAESAAPVDVIENDNTRVTEWGLTKREYMATHILAGLMANPHLSKEDYSGLESSAVEAADKLLQELEK